MKSCQKCGQQLQEAARFCSHCGSNEFEPQQIEAQPLHVTQPLPVPAPAPQPLPVVAPQPIPAPAPVLQPLPVAPPPPIAVTQPIPVAPPPPIAVTQPIPVAPPPQPQQQIVVQSYTAPTAPRSAVTARSAPGEVFLLITGIMYIVAGIFAIISLLIWGEAIEQMAGDDTGGVAVLFLLILAIGGYEIFMGIIGIYHRSDREKAKLLSTLGAIALVASFLGLLFLGSVIMGGSGLFLRNGDGFMAGVYRTFSSLFLIRGSIVSFFFTPIAVFYLAGAQKNKV